MVVVIVVNLLYFIFFFRIIWKIIIEFDIKYVWGKCYKICLNKIFFKGVIIVKE